MSRAGGERASVRTSSEAGVSPARGLATRQGVGLGGPLALGFLVLVAAAPLAAALFRAASSEGGLSRALSQALADPATFAALAFGLKEAAASALLALLIGLPGAWLVARHDFPGKRLLKALAGVPFCVPPILVVLAFVLYFGRNGYANRLLMALFGLKEPPLGFLYSFWGLVFVHGFYNFPVVLQSVGDAWASIPRDREEAARTLGAGRLRSFAVGLLPSLLPSIVQSSALVFLFCFFSFVVVLVFGPLGGSTLEVEVYRAARMNADQAGAAALALVETVAALGVVLLLGLAERRQVAAARRSGAAQATGRARGAALVVLCLYALFLLLFFAGPLLSLAAEAFTERRGMAGPGGFGLGNFARLFFGTGAAGASAGDLASLAAFGKGPLLGALGDTLGTAIPAALLATFAGGGAALLLRGRKGALVEAALSLPLAVSGVVLALGWSFLFPSAGRGLVILVEAVATLPFTARSVSAALASIDRSPVLAARTLGASRLRAAWDVELRSALPVLLTSGAFAFSMAAGDASAALLIGAPGFEPLPLLVYRLVGAYRFPEACAAGLVLALATGVIFFAKDREAFHA
ncbi:MAG: iron ABC transporter permease [Spirochaetaceae bacterium]|nr:iron ABC transporter permease [Spirochaetaceae bacterium]